jgi:hypothetical protein
LEKLTRFPLTRSGFPSKCFIYTVGGIKVGKDTFNEGQVSQINTQIRHTRRVALVQIFPKVLVTGFCVDNFHHLLKHI